jgi:two-component system, response regulator RegA
MTVLVVDPDPGFRQQLRVSFERLGHAVSEADNREKAVDLALARDPQLVTSDLNVGRHSGMKLLRDLKDLRPERRAVIVTGFASVATAVRAGQLGLDGYLAKPTRAEQVVLASAPALREEPGRAADLAPPPEPGDDAWLSLDRAKWEYIQLVITASRSFAEASRRLGLAPRSLRRMLEKYPPAR